MEVVVASTLKTEAILGLDFLHNYRANIDLGKQKLSLGDQGCILPLVEANQTKLNDNTHVRVLETIQIPPCSEMEVMACLEELPGDGLGWWRESGKASTCSCGTTTQARVRFLFISSS